MTGKRVLYVSSEVVPYLPESKLSNMSFEAPKMVNDRGGQTRIFIPKYGMINERRHHVYGRRTIIRIEKLTEAYPQQCQYF